MNRRNNKERSNKLYSVVKVAVGPAYRVRRRNKRRVKIRLETGLRQWSLRAPVGPSRMDNRRDQPDQNKEAKIPISFQSNAREMLAVLLDVSQGSGPDHRSASLAVARRDSTFCPGRGGVV